MKNQLDLLVFLFGYEVLPDSILKWAKILPYA